MDEDIVQKFFSGGFACIEKSIPTSLTKKEKEKNPELVSSKDLMLELRGRRGEREERRKVEYEKKYQKLKEESREIEKLKCALKVDDGFVYFKNLVRKVVRDNNKINVTIDLDSDSYGVVDYTYTKKGLRELVIKCNYKRFEELVRYANFLKSRTTIKSKKAKDSLKALVREHFWITRSGFLNLLGSNKEFRERFLYLEFITKLSLANCSWVDDSVLSLLNKASILDLTRTKITSEGLKYLKNVENLDLSYCPKITTRGLANLCSEKGETGGRVLLNNIRKLDLSGTNIEDGALKFLENIEELDLSECHKINGEGLQYLNNVKKLNLGYNRRISDDTLEYLSDSVEELFLGYCSEVTFEGLGHLTEVKKLTVGLPLKGEYSELRKMKNLKELRLISGSEYKEKETWKGFSRRCYWEYGYFLRPGVKIFCDGELKVVVKESKITKSWMDSVEDGVRKWVVDEEEKETPPKKKQYDDTSLSDDDFSDDEGDSLSDSDDYDPPPPSEQFFSGNRKVSSPSFITDFYGSLVNPSASRRFYSGTKKGKTSSSLEDRKSPPPVPSRGGRSEPSSIYKKDTKKPPSGPILYDEEGGVLSSLEKKEVEEEKQEETLYFF